MGRPAGDSLAYSCLAIGLAALSALPATRAGELEQAARERFLSFRTAVAPSVAGTPHVRVGNTAVWVTTEAWRYVADLAGNQVFRCNSSASWRPEAPKTPQEASSRPTDPDKTLSARLIEETRRYAEALCDVPRTMRCHATVKHELLVVRNLSAQAVEHCRGRFLVRISELPDQRYFQMLFDPSARPVRVDTNVRTPAIDRLTKLLQQGSDRPAAASDRQPSISFGAFFDPGEHRFEISACSYEGEKFLTVGQRENPFGRDNFDVRYGHRVDVDGVSRVTGLPLLVLALVERMRPVQWNPG